MTFPKLEDVTVIETKVNDILHARRSTSYGGQPSRMDAPNKTSTIYMINEAFRGDYASQVARFDADQLTEWGVAVLNHLTEGGIHLPKEVLTFKYDEGWTEAKAEILRIFNQKLDADIEDVQGEYDHITPEEFTRYFGTTAVEDGKVTDPWGYNMLATCRWWIENMTPFMVFSVWQALFCAMEEEMAMNLTKWALGDSGSDPRKAAEDRFQKSMANLTDFISGQIG